MTEQTPEPMAAASIEDNYPEYIDDEFGYGYAFADLLSQREIARHDQLVHADAAALEALVADGFGGLSDLDLWAVARAWRRLGNTARYLETAEHLIKSDAEHPAISYSEISRHLAVEHARDGQAARALAQLEAHLTQWPEDPQAQQLRALLQDLTCDPPTLHAPDSHLNRFAARFPQDAEIRLEIAEDLWHLGHSDAARAWLKEARQVARAHDRATLVDVELLAARLLNSPPKS